MAVQYAFSQITTTGLKLAVDAADPLSYPGSGTSWTDVTGNGFTGTISSSISFATTFRGALVSSNSSSAVSFSGSAANFGTDSFTVEMAFSPSVINGTHWLYSKNSGSFPNFGAFITGSGGSGRITAFYNISSTISSSATTAVGSIVTGSNYVLDVTYTPLSLFTSVYLNSDLVSNVGANGSGSLTTSASLLLLNNTTSSNSGTVGNLYNFKVYNPFIGSANIRKNYNSMCSRFGLPLALYTPPSPLLLDLYPGSAAAYSLRKLSENYLGFSIQVRRSSDNAVLDIGFEGTNLDTTTLLSFVGAGDGFVTTWYDQSGNGNNATQTTAINQPQIVSAGVVINTNSKPSLLTDGTNDSFTITSINTNATNYTLFNVGKRSASGVKYIGIAGGTSPGQAHLFWSDNNYYFQKGIGILTSTSSFATANQQIMSAVDLQTTANNTQYVNGSVITSTYGAFTLNRSYNRLFQLETTNFSSGNTQEIIIWLSDQTSNLTAINTNMNTYYGIY
jgi:hypothetical protein